MLVESWNTVCATPRNRRTTGSTRELSSVLYETNTDVAIDQGSRQTPADFHIEPNAIILQAEHSRNTTAANRQRFPDGAKMTARPLRLWNRKSIPALILVAFTILAHPSSVHAWGRLGHRVISRLAKQHMTEKARDALAELLEPGETIADASTWADSYRSQHRETGPWHYVDVPLDEPK